MTDRMNTMFIVAIVFLLVLLGIKVFADESAIQFSSGNDGRDVYVGVEVSRFVAVWKHIWHGKEYVYSTVYVEKLDYGNTPGHMYAENVQEGVPDSPQLIAYEQEVERLKTRLEKAEEASKGHWSKHWPKWLTGAAGIGAGYAVSQQDNDDKQVNGDVLIIEGSEGTTVFINSDSNQDSERNDNE